MTHYGLDFFCRSAAQKVVVERDPRSFAKPAHIGAHPCSLAGCINFVNLVHWNAIGPGQTQDRGSDFRVVKGFYLIKDGENKNWGDHPNHNIEGDGSYRSPNPPSPGQASDNAEQYRDGDCSKNNRDE